MSNHLTKLMFLRDSKPLANTSVRLRDEPKTQWVTDEDGRLNVTLSAGTHVIEVMEDEQWIMHNVEAGPERDSLLIVQTAGSPHQTPIRTTTAHAPTLPFATQLQSLETRYRFDHVLGRGGMGVVIKAHDRVLDRVVAMKMLSESLQDNKDAQDIFMVEARQIAKLRHPNLVAVHDVTSVDGVTLLVFEFVDGVEVEQIMNEQGALPEVLVRSIAAQLGSALHYVHTQNMIHRDIKPSNLILKRNGVLKVIDFGLARSLEQINIRGTQVRGTPAYMAPEQIQGEDLGPATDMYQVGVSLFELVAGQLPFDEKKITFAHLFEDAPPIASFVPGINPELAQLIDRCLSKNPAERPTSMEFMSLAPNPEELDSIHEQTPAFAQYMGDEEDVFALTGQFAVPTREMVAIHRANQTMRNPAVASPAPQPVADLDAPAHIPRESSSKKIIMAVLALVLLSGGIAAAAYKMSSGPSTTPPATTVAVTPPKEVTPDGPEQPAQPSNITVVNPPTKAAIIKTGEALKQAQQEAKQEASPEKAPTKKVIARTPPKKSSARPSSLKTPKSTARTIQKTLKQTPVKTPSGAKPVETVGSRKPSETKPLPDVVLPPKVVPKKVKPEPKPAPDKAIALPPTTPTKISASTKETKKPAKKVIKKIIKKKKTFVPRAF